MTPVRTALVGYGYAGRIFHAPLIRAAGLDLRVVVSSRLDEVQTDLPYVKVCDFDAALNDPAIELMVIATPNALHAPQAMAALKAGKHVVIDKPFAVDVTEAEAVISAARAADRLVSVFHNRRWDGDFLTIRDLIQNGRLQDVSLFISRFDRFRPTVRERWREQEGPGSGVWADLGAHLVDQALCLFGWPKAVSADIVAQRPGAVVDDYFHVTLHYGPARVRLQASTLTPAAGPRFEVHARTGSYVKHGLDPQEDQLRVARPIGRDGWGVDRDGMFTPVRDDMAPLAETMPTRPGQYQSYYKAVAQAIRGAGPLPVRPEDALDVMRLLDAGRQSATEGRTIDLSKSTR